MRLVLIYTISQRKRHPKTIDKDGNYFPSFLLSLNSGYHMEREISRKNEKTKEKL